MRQIGRCDLFHKPVVDIDGKERALLAGISRFMPELPPPPAGINKPAAPPGRSGGSVGLAGVIGEREVGHPIPQRRDGFGAREAHGVHGLPAVLVPASGGWVVPNYFAGSIMWLTPGTSYECKFHMTDPDNGPTWSADTTVTVSTIFVLLIVTVASANRFVGSVTR